MLDDSLRAPWPSDIGIYDTGKTTKTITTIEQHTQLAYHFGQMAGRTYHFGQVAGRKRKKKTSPALTFEPIMID